MSRFLNPQPANTSSATPLSSVVLPLSHSSAYLNVPVKYADLGKDCKDLLSKDFPFDVKKVEVNTITPNKVAFTFTGSQNNLSGASASELKIKYPCCNTGFTLVQKWSMDNLLTTEIEGKDTFTKGLSHKLETQFAAAGSSKTSSCSVKVSTNYVRRHLHVDSTLDLLKGPTVSAGVVAGARGLFVGGDVAANAQSGAVDRYTLSAALFGTDFQVVVAARNKLSEYVASYYHAVSPTLSTGCTATLNPLKSNNVHFEFGSAVKLSPISGAKVKMDSAGHLTLAYAQEFAQGVKGTICALINTRSIEKDSAKIGFQLNFNA